MLREPSELRIDSQGRIELPMSLLAEAGIAPEAALIAFSDGDGDGDGDGRIVLRRAEDAMRDLIERGQL
ncbi:hypothetical protein [Streptomyces parvus]|uniref:SpoVT-AbrB domain-containing protein n=1 Tax=Streptomyces parvus TaxID=66428 RepID=A0A7K3RVP5_9ACTN|nr:hypothetical protein [Streptomyces parvus]NEC19281.1 hypothetical protein [Streptomyces parvus]